MSYISVSPQNQAVSLHNGFTNQILVSQMVHRYSIKVVGRNDAIRKDGSIPVQLQAIINRKRVAISLSLNCMPDEFEENGQRIRYKKKNDPDGQLSAQANFTIDQARVRAQQIFNKYRYLNISLTVETFKKEFESSASNNQVCSFIETVLLPDYEKVMKQGTMKSIRSSFHNFKNMVPHIKFSDMTPFVIDSFDAHLRKNKVGMNTRMKYHKIMKACFKKAIDHNMLIENPYEKFKIRAIEGNRTWLEIDEMKAIIKLYNENRLNRFDQNELKNFIFCMFTGLRYSDMENLKDLNIIGDILVFTPVKTEYIGKIIQVPLSKIAKTFITQNIIGQVFNAKSNNTMNRSLKVAAKAAGIKKTLTTHVARHTFATVFIELGGDVVALKEILGHRKLETTMRYVHISNASKIKGVANFDKEFSELFK